MRPIELPQLPADELAALDTCTTLHAMFGYVRVCILVSRGITVRCAPDCRHFRTAEEFRVASFINSQHKELLAERVTDKLQTALPQLGHLRVCIGDKMMVRLRIGARYSPDCR